MKKYRTQIITYFAIVMCTIFMATPSHAAEIPHKLQAAIFFKILNYDKAVVKRNGSNIVFHVVIDSATSNQKSSIKPAFSSISGAKVQGKSISVKFTSINTLKSEITETDTHIIYLPSGSQSGTLSAALQIATSQKAPVFAGSESLVQKGAAVGITLQDGKPKIVVNIKQSKIQGMELSSQLLKLAKIIK